MSIKREIIRFGLFFVIGGIGYAIIELLWRGHTHPTMVIAGGICFVLFSMIAQVLEGRPLILKALLGAVCVTAIELIFGVIFNMVLGMGVWDYSAVPYNFLGQICLLYTFYWCVLGFVFIPIAEVINRKFAQFQKRKV